MALGGILGKVGRVFGLQGGPKPQTYGGTRPFVSLKDIPETKEYLDLLRNRMSGRDVGFRPTFTSRTDSPYARQRRESFEQRESPLISSQASLRGLGKSVLPTSRTTLSKEAADRDIESRIAEMSLRNEQQKRDEINRAVQSFGEFPLQEAGVRGQAADFNVADWRRIQTEKQLRDVEQMQGLKKTMALIGKTIARIMGSIYGGQLGGAAGEKIGGQLMQPMEQNYGEARSEDLNSTLQLLSRRY